MEEEDDCDDMGNPLIPETQVDVDEPTTVEIDERSPSLMIVVPRSMEEKDNCNVMNKTVILETQVIADEPTTIEIDECNDSSKGGGKYFLPSKLKQMEGDRTVASPELLFSDIKATIAL